MCKKFSSKNYIVFFLFSILLTTGLYAQDFSQKIATAYRNFENSASLKNGVSSLTVLDSKTGQVLFENNGQIGLPTASTLKVITSITALDILGPDYTFKTNLYYTGEIDSLGVLHGDIVIEGDGDPTLGSSRFDGYDDKSILETWISSIRKTGIVQINGRIIADDRLYNGYRTPNGYNWVDMGNYYGAGLSSLNWKENKIGVNFNVSRVGQAANLAALDTNLSYLELINEVTTGANGSGDNVYAYSAPYSSRIFLRGTYGLDLKKTIEISSPDPAYDVAHALHAALRQQNIDITGRPQTTQLLQDSKGLNVSEGSKLHTLVSPPLKDIVYWFNQKSINLYGEAILIAVARLSSDKTDTRNAAILMEKYWNQRLNIPMGELRIYDGSGLSQQNRVTTSAMAKIMRYAQSKSWYDNFLNGLPTINAQRMKSGTIGGVLGYTGYQKLPSGQEVVFSILVNNYTGSAYSMRQNMFKVLNTMK